MSSQEPASTVAARTTAPRSSASPHSTPQPTPSGDVLIAEVSPEPRAAIEVATGAAIADPFRPTAQLVELLAVRANSCGGAWSRVAGWGPTREPSPCVRRSRRDKPAGRVQGTGFSKGEAHVDH